MLPKCENHNLWKVYFVASSNLRYLLFDLVLSFFFKYIILVAARKKDAKWCTNAVYRRNMREKNSRKRLKKRSEKRYKVKRRKRVRAGFVWIRKEVFPCAKKSYICGYKSFQHHFHNKNTSNQYHTPHLFILLCGCGDCDGERFFFHNHSHWGINSFYYCWPIKIITASNTTHTHTSWGRQRARDERDGGGGNSERVAVICKGVREFFFIIFYRNSVIIFGVSATVDVVMWYIHFELKLVAQYVPYLSTYYRMEPLFWSAPSFSRTYVLFIIIIDYNPHTSALQRRTNFTNGDEHCVNQIHTTSATRFQCSESFSLSALYW